MIKKYILFIIFIVLIIIGCKNKEYSFLKTNWYRFRGAKGLGISEESGWNPKSLKKGKDIAWQINVGQGYSSVVISGDYLYTTGYNKRQDTVFCINVNDGSVIWSYSYPIKSVGYNGTRATPLVEGDFVYTFSHRGDIFCFDSFNRFTNRK